MHVGGTNVDEAGLSLGGATDGTDGIVELALCVPVALPTPGYLFSSRPGGGDEGGGGGGGGGTSPAVLAPPDHAPIYGLVGGHFFAGYCCDGSP